MDKREEGEYGGGDGDDGNKSKMAMVSKSRGLIQRMRHGLYILVGNDNGQWKGFMWMNQYYHQIDYSNYGARH